MELCDLTAATLSSMLRKGEISSQEVTGSVLRRMEEREGDINAYITRTPDKAIKQAKEADERFRKGGGVSRLNGIPIGIKDNMCTRGIRTSCGSKILADYIPPYDASVVKRVFEDGCVMVGKLNMDEFAMGSSNENSAFGPARNPMDTDRVTGGSSGGSAAAVAAGEAILTLGSDTGGSIRLPSSYCGVVGIKPTYGRVSRYGLISYASSLDQIGALGRSVEDCAMLLDVICGHDPLDTTSANVIKPDFLKALDGSIKGLKIGLPKEYLFVEGLDPGVKDVILKAIELLESNGVDIFEISLPHSKVAISAYYLIATAEASSNLARYDGVKYGIRTKRDVSDMVGMVEETRSEGFGTEVKRRIMLGTYVLSAGYYDAYYLKAQEARALIKRDFDQALESVDCILSPVSPCTPFKLGEKIDDPLQMYLVDIYTCSVNLAGLPGISVPCGTSEGLPVGLQIIGRPFDEATILRLGHVYEKIRGENWGSD